MKCKATRGGRLLIRGAAHTVDQRKRIGRRPVAAPGNMLVRPRQHQAAAIEKPQHPAFRDRAPSAARPCWRAASLERGDVSAESNLSSVNSGAHRVVERTAVGAPEMRRAAARHRRRRVAAHRVGRMFRAVIGDDRRAIVIGAEIEAGAGILLDVDLVGEPADLVAARVRLAVPRPRFLGGTAPRRRISASACDIANCETWLVIGQRSAS